MKCPYAFLQNLFQSKESNVFEAKFLRVSVVKKHETVVNVSLPAQSARWLIDLIPEKTVQKIKEEGIPLEEIQAQLTSMSKLFPTPIFNFNEEDREINIWLE